MKKTLALAFLFLSVLFLTLSCSTNKSAGVSKAVVNEEISKHPESMENMDCLQCHQDITPSVVKEWEMSAHGFTGVKCQVCHGDEENFRTNPGNDICQGCHSYQVENNLAEDKSCSTCHTVHNFTVHKVKQYK